MHVYHYATYEIAALQRLMELRHARGRDRRPAAWRRARRPLQGRQASAPHFRPELLAEEGRGTLLRARDGGVGGEESTVVFERWLESRDDELLQQIEDYNRDDCVATAELHQWLLEQRPDAIPWAGRRRRSSRARRQSTRKRAGRARGPPARAATATRWLTAQLLHYHERNAKPAWWEYFRRLTLDEQQLIEDADAIGGIRLDESVEPWPLDRSLVYELTFPPQEYKVGAEAVDPVNEKSPGGILSIDADTGRILLKRGKKKQLEPLPKALVPGKPLRDVEQRRAVERVARALDGGTDDHRAAQDILTAALPRARSRRVASRRDDCRSTAATCSSRGRRGRGRPGAGQRSPSS